MTTTNTGHIAFAINIDPAITKEIEDHRAAEGAANIAAGVVINQAAIWNAIIADRKTQPWTDIPGVPQAA